MKITSLDKYNAWVNNDLDIALKAESVADALESHGMEYFNHAIIDAHIYTGKEVEKVLHCLEEIWPKGKELRAQDKQFCDSYWDSPVVRYGMSRHERKRLIEKKITPQQKRQLTNLYKRDDLAVIRHNFQISSITELTSVQAERLIQNRIHQLLDKQKNF